ncbi:NAD(P)/FAD-dependent oxidoreductase [Nocardioides immobilis]|uniref:NAD(P)/FAD-dependent oxidoreductase n=1 Tax=Nocardioides immobilis TaxID=2049295 RepID=A0A417Y0Y4_9ACTN|nr:NAD(P)/FAD-dependent oxidoreductase [Nocardioides immobilis]RHW26265.1 NAD(P)/FAD-dependent oxidoreductase [Nocardioides immobilis]
MTQTEETFSPSTSIDAESIASAWLYSFAQAVESGNVADVVGLFAESSWWRDAVVLSWNLRTLKDHEGIQAYLAEHLEGAALREIELWDGAKPAYNGPDDGSGYVEVFFRFRTAFGWGLGDARLKRGEEGEWAAWTVMTSLQELDGFELAVGANRREGERIPKQSWSELRRRVQEFEDEDPQVIILGGGQGGLTAAAYLELMGVRALVIERNDRVGDVWRKRYDSLVLHDPIWLDQMAFMPYPEAWPVYTPKDKVGDWFDMYAQAMDLNVWTGSEMTGCTYSEDTREWTVEVRRSNGETRTVRAPHFILATGVFTDPHIPDIEGMHDFEGVVRHTTTHGSGKPWAGKRALVVGTGNSGNDVAKDLADHGAKVDMLQRTPTYVITQKDGLSAVHGTAYLPSGPGVQVADLMNLATPYPVSIQNAPAIAKIAGERDQKLLKDLEAVGYRIDDGQESGGMIGLGLRSGGGFCIDVGSCDYIVDGRIGVVSGELARFTKTGIELTDGRSYDYDLVVMATGFKNMRESARRIVGDSVADHITPIWGLDEEGELQGLWRPTGHPGFWVTGGSFSYARIYSRFLTIQIVAELSGKKK